MLIPIGAKLQFQQNHLTILSPLSEVMKNSWFKTLHNSWKLLNKLMFICFVPYLSNLLKFTQYISDLLRS